MKTTTAIVLSDFVSHSLQLHLGCSADLWNYQRLLVRFVVEVVTAVTSGNNYRTMTCGNSMLASSVFLFLQVLELMSKIASDLYFTAYRMYVSESLIGSMILYVGRRK